MAAPFPNHLDDLTTDWLTAALRDGERIDTTTRVVSMSVEPLGAGAGFAGSLARLTISYEGGDGPASIVAKLPTSIRGNRASSELLGVYEREIMVYRELLADLPVPTAGLAYAAVEVDPKAEKQIENLAKVERLPIWLLRILGRIMLHSPAAKPKPSVLLVDDLAPAKVGDQVKGCARQDAQAVVGVAAALHAATWGPLAPPTTHWLLPGDVAPKLFQAAFLDTRRALLKRGGTILGPHTRDLIEMVRQDGRAVNERLHRNSPLCLCHGDLRLDNIFFNPNRSVAALIDWQLAYLGPGVIDLAYFITGSLPADTPEREVDELIAFYHEQLLDHGISGYSLDRLRADYDDALLIVLQRMAGIDNIDFGEGRGVDLVDIWLERVDARLRRVEV